MTRRPSAKVTVTSSPRRLWALVRTLPWPMTTPEPRVPRPIPTMDGPTRSATPATAVWSSSMTLIGLVRSDCCGMAAAALRRGDRLVTCNLLLTADRDKPRPRTYHPANARHLRPPRPDAARGRPRPRRRSLEPAGRRGAPRRPASVQRARRGDPGHRAEHPL